MGRAARSELRLIHNLARTGSTVFCKCIGSMSGVALLSEIHPLGARIFNPLDQAQGWHQLFDTAEIRRLAGKRMAFSDAIAAIDEKCRQKGLDLVIRDWAHIDFHALPFAPYPSFRLSLREALESRFSIKSVFTVRRPIDTWLSLSRLDVMKEPIAQNRFSIESFMTGYFRFAQLASRGEIFRYEDFVQDPGAELRRACDRLDLAFDPDYETRWRDYKKITGDVEGTRASDEIAQLDQRKTDIVTISRFEANKLYHESLKLLGYTSKDA